MSELSVLEAAREAPAQPGLIAADRVYRFADLAAHVDAAIPAQGGEANAPVALVARRTLETVVTLYALLEARRPAILLHPRLTAAERAVLDSPGPLDPERGGVAFVLYTSGSRGKPRPVALPRAALLASARASAANLGWRREDRWLCALPLAHVGGLSILLRCLVARRCAVLLPEEPFDPDRVIDAIERHRVTLLSLVPTMLARLLEARASWRPPPFVRAVLVGGASLPAPLLGRADRGGWPIATTYGMTETCGQICTEKPGEARPLEQRGVGRPLPGVELRVGADHRIAVRGPMLMSGFAPPAWYETGDRGAIDGDGILHVLGRADERIITGGENVDPSEVEQHLASCPGVRAACVFSVTDPVWGEIVAAALVADEAFCEAILTSHLAASLASHKRPRRICLVPALPTGPSGKVDRAEVARRVGPDLRPLPRSNP